jgi:GNAT superfamily N-acetyltransferase
MQIERLTVAHRAEFAAFECAVYREPWTEIIEEMVRDHLADALDRGVTEGIGARNEHGVLVGVAAWARDPENAAVWLSRLIAVRWGHHGRKIGRRLKSEVLTRAQREGVGLLVSRIHEDNEAMRRVNELLGGRTTRPPGEREYLMCTIPVPPVVVPPGTTSP